MISRRWFPTNRKSSPPHIVELVQHKLKKASSAYWVKDAFAKAIQKAKYPPGFESSHPAYLAYSGPGIPAAEHIQNHLFDFNCRVCHATDHVIVRSSEWGVNIQNGDARGTFQAECTRCGKTFAGRFED